MSHGAQEPLENRPVPVSKGLPGSVQTLLVIAVFVVFVMGAFVVISSGFGRIWPAAESSRVVLPTRH